MNNDETVFDPILGRLRTVDKQNITGSPGSVINQTIQTGTSVGTGISVPATGSEGDIFYDTDDGVLYIYANGMWNAISGGGGTTDPGADIFGLLLTRNLN